jgi:hypothetical protein
MNASRGDSVEIALDSADEYVVKLRVAVRYSTFAAEVRGAVPTEGWWSFLRDLGTVERRRHGEARLESVAPGGLALRFHMRDTLGHCAVEGMIGERSALRAARLEFGPVEVDPSVINEAVSTLNGWPIPDRPKGT